MLYIFFWKPYEKPYGIFSQWYKSDFIIDNVKYNCAEQYMMAQKAILFKDYEIHKKILQEKNPFQQKKLGRLVKNFNNEVWKEHRYKIVLRGNMEKFKQNIQIKNILLNTKNAYIVEASPYDKIWSCGLKAQQAKDIAKWTGLNLLGKILMEVRNKIKS